MPQTVLVVDDEREYLELLEALLAPDGYEVVPCPVPTEAHQKVSLLQPKIVIVDLLAEGGYGWRVIDQLTSDPQLAGKHIILCTARARGAAARARAALRLQRMAKALSTNASVLGAASES
jgi:CheY-like chemotaxis protein